MLTINDEKIDEKTYFRDQTTFLSNRYEADINGLTVANRLANLIVCIESYKTTENKKSESSVSSIEETEMHDDSDSLNEDDNDVIYEEAINRGKDSQYNVTIDRNIIFALIH